MENVLVIGVAGGSGSGKTTLIEALCSRFQGHITVLPHDNYYKAHDDLTYEERTTLNYDEPAAFETDMMIEHVRALKQGHAVQTPVYDYTVHNRSSQTLTVQPSSVLLLDGILILENPALCQLMDIRVFVDTDADVRLSRRILRDTKERARSVQSVVDQYLNTVKPMHEKYVEPSRRNAHIIIPEGGKNTVALELLEQRIRAHIRNTENIM